MCPTARNDMDRPMETTDLALLILSPHSDDACMQAFALLHRVLFAGEVHMASVFTHSHHTSAELIPQPRREAVPALRLLEDVRFCERFGVRLHWLDLQDRPLDEYPAAGSRLVRHLRDRVLVLLDQFRCSSVVCPLPHGESVHPHHVAVYLAAVAAIAARPGTVLLLVDDQPYSRIPVHEDILVNGLEYVPRMADLNECDLLLKTEAMSEYTTQMRGRYFEAIKRPAPGDSKSYCSESLWIPSALKDDFSELRDPRTFVSAGSAVRTNRKPGLRQRTVRTSMLGATGTRQPEGRVSFVRTVRSGCVLRRLSEPDAAGSS